MNKEVCEEFKYIHDEYLLQCMCTEFKDKIIDLQEENRKQDEILKWYVHQNKENIELIMDLFKEIDELRSKESE